MTVKAVEDGAERRRPGGVRLIAPLSADASRTAASAVSILVLTAFRRAGARCEALLPHPPVEEPAARPLAGDQKAAVSSAAFAFDLQHAAQAA